MCRSSASTSLRGSSSTESAPAPRPMPEAKPVEQKHEVRTTNTPALAAMPGSRARVRARPARAVEKFLGPKKFRYGRAEEERPKQVEATCRRVAPSHVLATSNPLCNSPKIWLLGMRHSLNSKMELG